MLKLEYYGHFADYLILGNVVICFCRLFNLEGFYNLHKFKNIGFFYIENLGYIDKLLIYDTVHIL